MLGAERDADAAVAESAFDEGFVGWDCGGGEGGGEGEAEELDEGGFAGSAAAYDAVEVGGEGEVGVLEVAAGDRDGFEEVVGGRHGRGGGYAAWYRRNLRRLRSWQPAISAMA